MDKKVAELFEPVHMRGLERVRFDGEVRILYRGIAWLGYSETDPVGRDFVIASLLNSKVSGKLVAALCAMSEAHVTGVRKRVQAGGVRALATRGKRGAKPKLSARGLKRAVSLREGGASLSAIGEALGVGRETARQALLSQGVSTSRRSAVGQASLPGVGAPPSAPSSVLEPPPRTLAEPAEGQELRAGASLPAGSCEHPSRYAGTLLIAAALAKLGVPEALCSAEVKRPRGAVYDAHQATLALACSWISGLPSLSSMHEQDARGLGVVLGLERSPSVRTLHRAIGQMSARFDPVVLGAQLMSGLRRAGGAEPLLFGVDGHVKAYTGKAPIDKGWDSKRRMAVRALSEVHVHDAQGRSWWHVSVPPGDALSQHLLEAARALRRVHGSEAPIVLGFDRGGFCFDTLCALHREGFFYLSWVPSTTKMPQRASIAPAKDGVGELPWEHPKLDHHSRLLVERDGEALLPAATNLPVEWDATEAMRSLRKVRGVEENAFKAARQSVHLDRLVDRGIERERSDDRLLPNPERTRLKAAQKKVKERREEAQRGQGNAYTAGARKAAQGRQLLAEIEEELLKNQLAETPARVPRCSLEPDAKRAWLKTKNRALLLPLKLATENARRWLLATLGRALAPTDHGYDATALPRTLSALLKAPGTLCFGPREITITLQLPLAPTAHQRLDEALRALDEHNLRYLDQRRRLRFRLAPRPSRRSLPHLAKFP